MTTLKRGSTVTADDRSLTVADKAPGGYWCVDGSRVLLVKNADDPHVVDDGADRAMATLRACERLRADGAKMALPRHWRDRAALHLSTCQCEDAVEHTEPVSNCLVYRWTLDLLYRRRRLNDFGRCVADLVEETA